MDFICPLISHFNQILIENSNEVKALSKLGFLSRSILKNGYQYITDLFDGNCQLTDQLLNEKNIDPKKFSMI